MRNIKPIMPSKSIHPFSAQRTWFSRLRPQGLRGWLAGAGVLIGLSFNAIEPTMGTSMGLKGLAVLIMGGLGNVEGAMAGGFILGIAEVIAVAYGSSTYRDAVAFGIIILILFIRPEGLFSKAGKGGRP